MVVLDLETRSQLDLKRVGAHKYARHPSTQILIISILKDGALLSCLPLHPHLSPVSLPDMRDHLASITGRVAAHNAEFDRLVYAHSDLPPITDWYDTAALCSYNALPMSLDNATRAIDASHKKDHRGNALIKALSIPPFSDSDDLMLEFLAYCERDVLATQALIEHCEPMRECEIADWEITQRINARGVRVDRDLAAAAVAMAHRVTERSGVELAEITDGAVELPTQVARAKHWLAPRMQSNPLWRELTANATRFDKSIRRDLLDALPTSEERDVIDLINNGNMPSVSKFQRMLDLSDDDDARLRGAIVHAGAGRTLRYSSRGLQLHNMRRDTPDDPQAVRDAVVAGQTVDVNTLSGMLRPALIPQDGHVFVVGDWSAIEARVLPWLADDPEAETVLDVFREGDDIYLMTAERMGTTRQIGKTAVLALGFGGAVGAFANMARTFGIELSETEMLNHVTMWRRANPWARKFWNALESAVNSAFSNPNKWITAGRVKYRYDGHTLTCLLPDGSTLRYPQFKRQLTQHGVGFSTLKASRTPKVGEPWPRDDIWYGLLAENITQATAAAVLRALLRHPLLTEHCVFHVHDEVVIEVPEGEAETARDELQRLMETAPDWAPGLPLAAEPVIMSRYGKG